MRNIPCTSGCRRANRCNGPMPCAKCGRIHCKLDLWPTEDDGRLCDDCFAEWEAERAKEEAEDC